MERFIWSFDGKKFSQTTEPVHFRFGERLRGFPAGAVRAVGTNTLRVAKNAPEFITRAELSACDELLGRIVSESGRLRWQPAEWAWAA